MAYTIIRSDGTVLTTIQDGTINTTSTSLGLPGRNKAGYGQTLDTNMVRLLESFANDSPPAHPLRGQLWYNTNDSTLRVCPADGTTVASSWPILASTSSAGDTTLGNVTVTGDILGNNISVGNTISGDTITVRLATVSANLSAVNAAITTANLTTTRTQVITAGGTTANGTMTGYWKIDSSSGNGLYMNASNIAFNGSSIGIKCDNYMNADGTPFTPTGTYDNDDVKDYLTGANSVTQFTGNIAPTKVTTTVIAGGGEIRNVWTLATGARIQATYADLAERYEADATYGPGTVVELGGDKEITAVKDDASEEVFGVISTNPAYLLNGPAGTDETHPAVALAGRVNVKVVGKIRKGQRLISAGNGLARGASKDELTAFNCIGRALANKTDDGEGVVEAVVIVN